MKKPYKSGDWIIISGKGNSEQTVRIVDARQPIMTGCYIRHASQEEIDARLAKITDDRQRWTDMQLRRRQQDYKDATAILSQDEFKLIEVFGAERLRELAQLL